jgi:intein/homing endonuclease
MSDKASLFGKLTRLFKSGPVLKRRVRNISSQRASTAVEVFKKAHSDVYNATLSAYGAFDRMCVELDTKIAVPGEEKFLTMRELMERYPGDEKFLVYAYDHETKSVVPALAHHPRSSGVRKTVKITFDDGSHLVCTPDHPCMLRDGTFKDAGELEPGQSMMPFYEKTSKAVSYIEPWEEIETGDLTVDGYENFATDTIFVHNSRYSDFCLVGDTYLAVNHPDEIKKIKDIVNDFEDGSLDYGVFSYDHKTGNIVYGEIENAWLTGIRKIWEVTLDSGDVVRCTDNHPFMLHNGDYVRADELQEGQALMPFRRGKTKNGYPFNEFSEKYPNNQVVSVVETNSFEEVYDITVTDYHNFALANENNNGMVFVKNSEMESCIAGDTLIAVPDGYKTIKELAETYGENDTFVVYSYDHNKKQIVPAFAKQARKTTTAESIKITFEKGKTLVCTPDHRVMRRDGTYCEAQELKPGDSMMPFYRRNLFSKSREENDDHYRWIFTMDRENSKNGWVAEHRLIASWVADRKLEKNEEVHHINFVKYDNRPENLLIMDSKEHRAYHAKILNGKKWSDDNKEWINKFRRNHSEYMIANNPAFRHDISFELILNICDKYGFDLQDVARRLDCSYTAIMNRLESNGFNNFTEFARAYQPGWNHTGCNNEKENNPRYDKNLTFIDVANTYEDGITQKQLAERLDTTPMKINYRLKHEGYDNWTHFKENFANHKVVSIEPNGVIDLYDLTVDGYKNYATDTIVVHNTAEICSALDIYAEETVSPDENGNVLSIYSDNRKIQELLHELFYGVLNVEFNLVMWVRNLVKFGDFFLFNDISPDYGVINAYPISISEIEREEGYDANDPSAVRFRWITQGNQILENWQVSHFRMLGNDAFLPYGSSVLEGARRIWRQLILIEDAMLVYRVIRAPERRVFYIDVGNVPPEEVANYLEQAQTSLKRNQIVDKQTGKIDLRYNPLSVEEDYFLPVRGGESGTKIDTLVGGQNTAAIEDVEYIQKKLFAALKIPKAYLGYDDSIGSKATLSQEDIRFSRTIQRIQKTVISELNKIAQIHLFCHGFEGADLTDFKLFLSNPSTVAQMQKLELIRSKFEIASMAPEGSVNRSWIQKNVLGLNNSEIKEISEERIKDKLSDMELEKLGAPMEEGGGMFGGSGGGGFGGGLGGLGGADSGSSLEDDMSDDSLDIDLGDAGDEPEEDITSGESKRGDLLDGLPVKPVSSLHKLNKNKNKDEMTEDDDDEDFQNLSLLDEESIFKVEKYINEIERNNVIDEKQTKQTVFGNKSPRIRKRKHANRNDIVNPDFLMMVNHSRDRDSLEDPYGLETEPMKLFDETHYIAKSAPRLTLNLVNTLNKMSNTMNLKNTAKMQQTQHNYKKALIMESDTKGDDQ